MAKKEIKANPQNCPFIRICSQDESLKVLQSKEHERLCSYNENNCASCSRYQLIRKYLEHAQV